MLPLISIHTWVSLPNEVRGKVRVLFNIPRSSNTVVNDGVIETDGTTNDDLKHLTIEKMQIYLNDESTDFHKLFDKVLYRINNPQAPVIEPTIEIHAPSAFVVHPETVISEKKKRGRPAKIKEDAKKE